jgi:hypothetical protein
MDPLSIPNRWCRTSCKEPGRENHPIVHKQTRAQSLQPIRFGRIRNAHMLKGSSFAGPC